MFVDIELKSGIVQRAFQVYEFVCENEVDGSMTISFYYNVDEVEKKRAHHIYDVKKVLLVDPERMNAGMEE